MSGKSIARQTREAELDEAARISGLATEGKYHAGFDRRAHDYALLGATDDEIAGFLEVSPASVSRWMVDHPTFRRAVQKARVDAPIRVVKSLHRAANGFRHRETKLHVVNGAIKKTDITKTYPPNVQAAALILTNRAGAHWKDAKQVEHSGTIGLAALIEASMGDKAKVIEGKAERVSDPLDDVAAADSQD